MITVKALMNIRDEYTGKNHATGAVWDYAGFEQQINDLVAMGAIEIVRKTEETSAAVVEKSVPAEIKPKRGNRHG